MLERDEHLGGSVTRCILEVRAERLTYHSGFRSTLTVGALAQRLTLTLIELDLQTNHVIMIADNDVIPSEGG
jgi:hypothetical protein